MGASSLKVRWYWVGCAVAAVVLAGTGTGWGQGQDPHAQELVRKAVQTELREDGADHSHWMYRDVYRSHEGEMVFQVVETASGSLKKKTEVNGQPLSTEQLEQEDARIKAFVGDSALQAKQHRNNAQDDKQAESMLRMLPDAFLWSLKQDSGETLTLAFVPDPAFNPPTMESRVFAAMAGEIVVNKAQDRIQTIKGELMSDVAFGWGILGKMYKGGRFDVERRELAPGIWQITESHVHIEGHALIFKSIGEHDDEVKSEYKRTPADMTLARAAELLRGESEALNAMR